MGVLSDRLDTMRVRASSPDGKIVAELYGRTDVRLSFAALSYRYYDEEQLAEQLAGLARTLWARRMKEYYAALSEAFEETITGEPPPLSQRDADYYAARDELVAEGGSFDNRVRIAVTGMRGWSVTIAPGTLRRLPEEAFAARVAEAAGALITDQYAKIALLKQEIYG